MKYIFLFGMLLVSQIALSVEIIKLTPQQVFEKIKLGKSLVFDINPSRIYKEGYVPKARNLSFLDVSEVVLPKDKNQSLIFYCMNEMCTASHSAAKKAAELGYKNIYQMPSGIMGWRNAGYPIEK